MKWEYLVVEFFADIYLGGLTIKSGSKHTVIENGKKQIILNGQFEEIRIREHGESNQKAQFTQLPQFVGYLNDLGSKGWEMIAEDDHGSRYYFKRPL